MPKPKVDGYNWKAHETEALRHLNEIAKTLVKLCRNPHTAREVAAEISVETAAAVTALSLMARIAETDSRRLRRRIEELERNGNIGKNDPNA